MGEHLVAGTLTFLFTDVEASTRLLESLGSSYPDVIEQHRVLLREAFSRHEGHELGTQGDSFVVAFTSVFAAVAAAVEAQLALAAFAWPDQVLRVRMGLHTGDAEIVDGEYYGMTIHLAARVGSAAFGEQILLSQATADWRGTSCLKRQPLAAFAETGTKFRPTP